MNRRHHSTRSRKPNGPPPDQAWMWFTAEMMESDAWHALTLPARKVIDRIVIEHCAHGGTQNGDLVVTYDDFLAYGLSSRRMTAQAIRIAAALGFIDVTEKGARAFGKARRPSRYGLTWLPRCDRTPASNRWRTIDAAIKTRRLAAVAPGSTSANAARRWDRAAA